MPTDELSTTNKWAILPSGRLGYPVSINRSGRPVFADADGAIMCMHGEKAATIRVWLDAERTNPDFTRTSACTCRNVDGLMTPHTVACDLPAAYAERQDLYGLLGALGTAEKEIYSRPQRFALKTTGAELWVQPHGLVVCSHGNSRKILSKLCKQRGRCAESPPLHFRSKGVERCGCVMKIPRRHGSVFGDVYRAKRARPSGRVAVGVASDLQPPLLAIAGREPIVA